MIVPQSIFDATESGELPRVPAFGRPHGGHVLYTSGTTGTYKKVLYDSKREALRSQAVAKYRSFDRYTLLHNGNFPLGTAAGYGFPCAAWHVGGSVVLDQEPPERSVFFARPDITHATLLPQTLGLFLKQPESAFRPNHGMNLHVVGGFLSLNVAKEAMRRFTTELYVSYGATEICPVAMLSHVTGIDDLHWLLVLGPRLVEIVDELGVACPAGVEGMLRIGRAELDAGSYLDDEETSARFFRDGFFYPGDMAVQRDDGRTRVLGRATDVINVQGHKIAASPMEQTIQKALHVDEVCLFSRLTDAGEKELIIVIQTERDMPKPVLETAMRQIKGFRHVHICVLKRFPRTAQRKAQRVLLRQIAFRDSNPAAREA